jgi:hypothetical protein
LKSATVSSTVACPAFTDLYFDASPIVRVALEPKHASMYMPINKLLRQEIKMRRIRDIEFLAIY